VLLLQAWIRWGLRHICLLLHAHLCGLQVPGLPAWVTRCCCAYMRIFLTDVCLARQQY
jgi:hypothetical protein